MATNDLIDFAIAEARRQGVDPSQILPLIGTESSWNPSAVSPKGAAGLMQLMPGTARDLGLSDQDRFDPAKAIPAGISYYKQQLERFGTPELAYAAYNAGPGAVAKYGGVPPYAETQNYVRQNMAQSGFDGSSIFGNLTPQGTPASGFDGSSIFQDAPKKQQKTAEPSIIPQPQSSALSTDEPRIGESLLTGVGRGIGNTALAIEQLLGKGANAVGLSSVGNWLSNDAQYGINQIKQEAKAAENAHPIATSIGNIVGTTAATLPSALVAPELGGASLLGKAGIGAGIGAASGALSPVDNKGDFWAQKAKQAALGGLVGGIATPATSAIGNLVSGVGGTAQKALADAGVTMTPGQILGGAWQRTEDKLSGVIPVLGDMMKNAQQRSIQSFNKAAYNQVLAPLGKTYDGPVGHEGITAVQRTIGDAYDAALSKMSFSATDPQFQADINNLASMVQSLPNAQQQSFMNVLKNQIFGKIGPQGNMDGQTLKGVQSELSRIARGYQADQSFDNRQLGAAIGEIKNALDSSLSRTNPQEAVQGLNAANQAWANFTRLRSAAGSQGAGNNEGIFTAAQLNNAVRSGDKSVGKGAFARGQALMQDLSGAGQQVLGSKYPDSGTAGRLITNLGIGGLAGHAFLPAGTLGPTAIGGALAALPYTTAGQKAMQSLLMSRPAALQPIGQAIINGGGLLAPVLGTSLLH